MLYFPKSFVIYNSQKENLRKSGFSGMKRTRARNAQGPRLRGKKIVYLYVFGSLRAENEHWNYFKTEWLNPQVTKTLAVLDFFVIKQELNLISIKLLVLILVCALSLAVRSIKICLYLFMLRFLESDKNFGEEGGSTHLTPTTLVILLVAQVPF